MVYYTDAKGTTCTSYKDFKVPTTALDGTVLNPDDVQRNREMVLKKAHMFWNANDKSAAPRFPIADVGLAANA